MAQISAPLRIALVAVLAIGALWLTVLRPKPADPAPAPTAPGVAGLESRVSAAEDAATASDAANAKMQAATGGTQAKTAGAANIAVAGKATTPATAKAKAKAAPVDRSKPLVRALRRGDAVALLFWSRRAPEDRAVRSALAAADRRHGRLVVRAAPMSQVARYSAITRGAQVFESPTVLVIAPNRTARAIVGFTTTSELDQAVGDALAAARRAKQ